MKKSFLVIFIAITLWVIFQPSSEINLLAQNQPPSLTHWLGTDTLGRDLLNRVVKGSVVSLWIGWMTAVADLMIGVTLGTIAAMLRGKTAEVMMRSIDIVQSVPYLLVAIIIVTFLDAGFWGVVIALAITGWATMARLVYGHLIQLKKTDYGMAAVSLGASQWRIARHHLLPNAWGPVQATALLTASMAIFGEAFLSFLGLGIQAPTPSLGSLANEGLSLMKYNPWQFFCPAFALVLMLFSLHLLADHPRSTPLKQPKVNFSIKEGEKIAIVGPSGCGKTTLLKALLNQSSLRTAMIFQDPMTSLNPIMRVGKQLMEAHSKLTTKEAVEFLKQVGLDGTVFDRYPHELSGGMRQRLLIAMALAAQPHLLFADEPTAFLDPFSKQKMIELVCLEPNRAVLLATHDVELAKAYCDRVVELEKPKDIHWNVPKPTKQGDVFVTVCHLTKVYPPITALSRISFKMNKKQTLGVLGPNGVGKSTLGRLLLRLIPPTTGEIIFAQACQNHQMIFQDAYASLNPKMTVKQLLLEPLIIHQMNRQEERVIEALENVGLKLSYRSKYPHELSGGEHQRVAIARALISNPAFVVCDEPVSSLEAGLKKEMARLLKDKQETHGTTYFVISHDVEFLQAVVDEIMLLPQTASEEITTHPESKLHPLKA